MAYSTVSYSNRAASKLNEDDIYDLPDIQATRDFTMKQDYPVKVLETSTEMGDTYAVPDAPSCFVRNVEKENQKKCTAVKAVVILSFLIAVVSIILATSFFVYGQFQSATKSEDAQALRNDTAGDIHALNANYQEQIKNLIIQYETRILDLEVQLNETVRNEIENALHNLQMESSTINETLFKAIENTQLSLRGLEEQIVSTRFLTTINSCNDIQENSSGEFWMLTSVLVH